MVPEQKRPQQEETGFKLTEVHTWTQAAKYHRAEVSMRVLDIAHMDNDSAHIGTGAAEGLQRKDTEEVWAQESFSDICLHVL